MDSTAAKVAWSTLPRTKNAADATEQTITITLLKFLITISSMCGEVRLVVASRFGMLGCGLQNLCCAPTSACSAVHVYRQAVFAYSCVGCRSECALSIAACCAVSKLSDFLGRITPPLAAGEDGHQMHATVEMSGVGRWHAELCVIFVLALRKLIEYVLRHNRLLIVW